MSEDAPRQRRPVFVPRVVRSERPAPTNAEAENLDLEEQLISCELISCAVHRLRCADRLLEISQNCSKMHPRVVKTAIVDVANCLISAVDVNEMVSQHEARQDLSDAGMVDTTAEGGVVVELTGMGTAGALVEADGTGTGKGEDAHVEATEATAGKGTGNKRARKCQGKRTDRRIRRSANFDLNRMDADISDAD